MPPKKKETSKKPETAKPPTLINGLTKEEMSKEQIEEHIVRLREELDRERGERNYFQLERDNIQTFREITDRKLDEVKAELKNLEKAIEDEEAHHQVEIKVFKQKMKHLLCEHQNTISDLEADLLASAEVLQDEQNKLEEELNQKMKTILVDMQKFNRDYVFKEPQLKHEEEMAEFKNKWERLLAETFAKNKAEMQQLQQEQNNTMKSVISEQELLWNGHYANLTEDFNTYLTDAREAVVKMNNETKKEVKALEARCSEKISELKTIKEALSALSKENKELAGVVAETIDEISCLEGRSNSFSNTKHSVNPQKKTLKVLKKDYEDLEQKFGMLQIEMDELRSSVPQKYHTAEKHADMSLRPMEVELQSLKDNLEKVQAQLQSVLSAPNVDQTAVAEIIHKVEKDLEARNSAIKDLKHKRYVISQARSAILLTAEGFMSLQKGLK